jgi:hypothetical protein
MAYRKRVIRKAPVRRRRRTMGAAMSAASIKSAVNTTLMGAAGGAAAAVLTNVIGDNLGGFKNYTGLVGALATSVFFKQPVIAAGMAGYAGSKVAAELTGSSLLAEGGMYLRTAALCTLSRATKLLAWLEKISTPATTR